MGLFYVPQNGQGDKFSWGRSAAAVLLLVVVAGSGVYATGQPDLKDWSTAMLHAFEFVLGLVIGLIAGGTVARR